MSRWGDNNQNITKPTEGYLEQGFIPGPNSPIPSGIFNWWMRHVHRRLSGFFRFGRNAEVNAYLGDGDVFVGGYSINGNGHPGGSGLTLTNNGVDIDHDGEFVIILEQGVAATDEARVHIIDLTGNTATRVHDLGQNDDYSAITCNGTRIAVSRANANGDVIVIDYDGATDFSYQHGAEVRDVCMDYAYVYCVGAEATGTVFGRGHLISDDGVTNWTFTRTTASADLWSCAVDGFNVWFAGEGDAGGGNEDLYKLNRTSGATDDSIAIGGGTQEVFGKGRIALTDEMIYVATTSSAVGAGLIVYGLPRHEALVILDTEDLSSLTAATWTGQITADDRFLYLGDDIGGNFGFRYKDGLLTTKRVLIGPATAEGSQMVSDGQYLHVIDEASPTSVAHIGIGRRPGLWQKVRLDGGPTNNNESADWFRRKYIPIGEQS